MDDDRGIPLRVLVLSADRLTLGGLTAILEQETDVLAVALEDPDQLTREMVADADVLLWEPDWDVLMNDLVDDWAVVTELIEEGMPVVAILPNGDYDGYFRQIGVTGLLPRTVRPRTLRAALHAAAAGLIVTDPAFVVSRPLSFAPLRQEMPSALTPRELEVLLLVAEGLTNRAIGSRLGISANTAKFHVQAVLAKLGVSSRTEAVVQATRLGLLTL